MGGGWGVGWLMPAEVAAAQVRTQVVAQGLTNPVAFVADPVDAEGELYVVSDSRGRILKLVP